MAEKRTHWNSTIRIPDEPKKLPRSPLPRSRKRPKNRRVPKRFAKRRDPEYCVWIRTHGCEAGGSEVAAARLNARVMAKDEPRILTAEAWLVLFGVKDCSGPIECAHVKTRSTGGDDRGNTLALCRTHHRQQHDKGIATFQALYGIDMAAIAKKLELAYDPEEPPVW